MTTSTWLFDIDGTLTPSRAPMREDFRAWFLRFASHNTVCFVTGGDYERTLAQVGPDILAQVHTSFNCMGNSVWRKGVQVHCRAFELPAPARAFLMQCLQRSAYPVRSGPHFEVRTGMVNFSVLGRGATQAQRQAYFAWDCEHDERRQIARILARLAIRTKHHKRQPFLAQASHKTTYIFNASIGLIREARRAGNITTINPNTTENMSTATCSHHG